jgi:acetyl esterase/lipase
MPKYRYPVAVNDCYSTYIWVVNKSEKLGIDSEKIIVTGDSAGANLSVAVSLMLKDMEQALPAGTMLIYPVLDRRMTTESMKKYLDTPVWDSVRNEMFWKEYLKNNEAGPLKYASPMEAESLKGFPKTYIEVAEFDCLHDEGRDFAERLKLEDVVTDYYEMKGTCHGFDDVFNSSLVSNAIERRVKWFQSVFS